jgi:hypothetical protein
VTRHDPRRSTVIGGVGVLITVLLAGCSDGSDRSTPSRPTNAPMIFVSHTPAASPARSFTAGSYIVGRDIELGRYSAGADVSECQWLQRDSAGTVVDRSGADRPTQVLTLSTRGSELVVTGAGCTFMRLS